LISSAELRVCAAAQTTSIEGLAAHCYATICVLNCRYRRAWVGVGIILFELVIPLRLALGMEFSVELMLVGLGIVNLRGAGGPVLDSAKTGGSAHTHSWPE